MPIPSQLPPGPAPAYSLTLEMALKAILSRMDADEKLKLARRMIDVFKYLEEQALQEGAR